MVSDFSGLLGTACKEPALMTQGGLWLGGVVGGMIGTNIGDFVSYEVGKCIASGNLSKEIFIFRVNINFTSNSNLKVVR